MMLFRLLSVCPILAGICWSGEFQSVKVSVLAVPTASNFFMPVGSRANGASDLQQSQLFGFSALTFPDSFGPVAKPLTCAGQKTTRVTRWFIFTPFNSKYDATGALYNAKGDYHPGEDWNAEGETDDDACQPVFAISKGVLIGKGSLDNFGNTVMIVHRLLSGEFIISIYAHLKETPTVELGSTVGVEQIGRIGNSGTRPYHLHWEIRKASFLVNDGTNLSLKADKMYKPSRWPAIGTIDNGKSFITNNYYSPSKFVSDRAGQPSRWIRAFPATQPPGLYSPTMAYDEARGQVVLFGSCMNAGCADGTWIWESGNWRRWQKGLLDISPTPGAYWKMAYDAVRQKIVLFGSSSGVGSDTWLWDGNAWHHAEPSAINSFKWPDPRVNPAMAYDWARGAIVMHGGGLHPSTGYYFAPDTWLWEGLTWLEKVPFSTSSNYPSPLRQYSAMSWDPVTRNVVLFGGKTTCFVDSCNTGGELNDTWLWDGNTWHQPNPLPSTKPGRRALHAMTIDPTTNRVMLVGGTEVIKFPSVYEDQSDTWMWSGTQWLFLQPTDPSLRLAAGNFAIAPDLQNRQVLLITSSPETGISQTWVWK